jgi:hypothetical protein
VNRSYLNRISIAAWVVTLTLAASAWIRLPGQGANLLAGEGSLALPIAGSDVVPLLLALLAGTGAQAVIQAHPLANRLRFSVRLWALPIAVTMIAFLLLPSAPSILYWAAGILLFAAALSGVLAALYISLDANATGYRRARALLNLVCYAVALLLFLLIPETWGAVGRALVLGGVAVLLALELLRGSRARIRWVTLYAAIIGTVVTQVTWVLAQTNLSMLSAGLLLLLLFYLLVGLAWQTLLNRLTRRVVLEFLAVGVFGLLLILILTPS